MADEAGEIEAAAEHFIRALDDLEWDQFAACWLPDSTAFFPGEDALLTDREAVLARFRRIFDHTDRSMGPPYLRLRPRNLRVFQCGDAGLVTFTLGATPDTVALRSLLFVRDGEA